MKTRKYHYKKNFGSHLFVASRSLSRLSVCEAGKVAAAANGILPQSFLNDHGAEVEIMQRHGLLVKKTHGGLELTALSTAAAVKLEDPQLLKPPGDRPDDKTVVELRSDLVDAGWFLVDKPSECQAANRRCMRCQSHCYFKLLLQYPNQVMELARMNAFSHSQQIAYYKAIALVCVSFPTATLMH